MLSRLVIQDVVLIDKLTLELRSGLNVFTGETGAGKSIVLDALGLALGARSDAGLIRVGAGQAIVTAEFSGTPSPDLVSLVELNGLVLEDPIILRRIVQKDGKSRAFINDQPIGVTLLKQIGAQLLEIHGQFETHGLLNSATHRGLLDAFAGNATLKKKVVDAHMVWQQAFIDYTDAATSRERAKAEEDFLRSAVHELNEISPEPNECEKLSERRTSLQHREKILDALQTTEQALNGNNGAVSALALAGKNIARVVDKAAGLRDLLDVIDRASHEIDEASNLLARFVHDIDAEPDALQRIEERLFALNKIARKHGKPTESLIDLHRDLKARLDSLVNEGDQLSILAKAVEKSKHNYKILAEELSGKRQKAAASLAKLILRELPPLKLERAQFVVEVTPLPEEQWGAEGMDRVTFLASTNPGTAAGALQKVASGGELARFMLALKVVLAANDPVPTMVFDEVDAGIGGATASAVGERLAKLAKQVQILVVTHSPQVAALGSRHLRVMKQTKAKQAFTCVEALNDTERVEEIARMLAGAKVTTAARDAAASLIG